MKETHLFLIWSKARYMDDKILDDLSNSGFEILLKSEIEWCKEKFSSNLSRFYGQNLPKNSNKEKHCGDGKFLCIVLNDLSPSYSSIDIGNQRGYIEVNTNIYNKKKLYRTWTGGGHKIHATNDSLEFEHDFFLLFGECYSSDFIFDHEVEFRNISGSEGWSSLDEIRNALSTNKEHVILRGNFDDDFISGKDDIDILTSSPLSLIYLLNLNKGSKLFSRSRYYTYVSNNKVYFDISDLGDGSFDVEWQKNMLLTKENVNNEFRLDNEQKYYSEIYHRVLHKNLSDENYKLKLLRFLQTNNYEVVVPKDVTLGFYPHNLEYSQQYYFRRLGYNYFMSLYYILRKIKRSLI